MTPILEKKVKSAIRLIQASAPKDGSPIEVSYSGGKDSDVILELTKMAGVNYRAIYKNTTIDPPGTIQHCKNNGVEILQPKLTFFQLMEKSGWPTRRGRFCCDVLKEYKVLDVAIQGIRRDESTARAARYTEPQVCRFYGSKKNYVSVILPILEWTLDDVSEFVQERNIKLAPHYYDTDGTLHIERRLGCMGCPMRSDNGLGEFVLRPRLFRRWVLSAKRWWDTHPNLRSRANFGSVYGLVAHNIFYDSYEDWRIADSGLFGRTDWKSKLEDYFGIDLTDKSHDAG